MSNETVNCESWKIVQDELGHPQLLLAAHEQLDSKTLSHPAHGATVVLTANIIQNISDSYFKGFTSREMREGTQKRSNKYIHSFLLPSVSRGGK